MPAQKIGSDKISEVWDQFLQPSIQKFEIAVAEQVLKSAVLNGFDTSPTVITDGVVRRDYHDVKPFGKIEFVSMSGGLLGAVNWILAQLLLTAPIGRAPDKRPGHPGFYKGEFKVLQNHAEVTDLNTLKANTYVYIVNTAIYAAKIEGRDAYTRWRTAKGNTSRRRQRKKQGVSAAKLKGISRQAPQGVFNVVYRLARQRYSRAIDIDYFPMELPEYRGTVTGLKKGRGRKRGRVNQVYPTIRLFVRSATH